MLVPFQPHEWNNGFSLNRVTVRQSSPLTRRLFKVNDIKRKGTMNILWVFTCECPATMMPFYVRRLFPLQNYIWSQTITTVYFQIDKSVLQLYDFENGNP